MAFSLERKSASNVLQLNFMKDFVVGKFKRIMLPYYVWSLLVVPLFFYNYDESLNYINCLYSVFVNNTSYWFLPCLFGLSIVYIIYKFVSSRISNNVFFKSITLLSLYAILLVIYKVTQYDFLRSISSYFVPFFVGVFMAEYKMVYKLVTENSKVYTFCLLFFCLLVGGFISSSNDELFAKLVRLICGLLAIPVCFNFCSHLKLPNLASNYIRFVGQNTLIIYIMQFSFLPGLVIFPNMNIFLQLICYSVLSLLLISLILFISKLFAQNRFLSTFFLGK